MSTQDYNKTILIFANSRKSPGRCVAGKEFGQYGLSAWLRPVSSRPGGGLAEADRQSINGVDPRMLDSVSITFQKPEAHSYQIENHLINDQIYWNICGHYTYNDASKYLDPIEKTLWMDGYEGRYGTNDKIPLSLMAGAGGSLRLIQVHDLVVSIEVEWPDRSTKRKVRGAFTYGRSRYRLMITDPVIERQFFAGADGSYQIGQAILCISVGEPFEDHAYKLIAGVLLPP